MKTLIVIVFLALAVSGVAQTADELIVKNLSARGGADKLRAIRTMTMTGTISFGDPSSPLTVKAGRPNQIREDFAIDGTSITRAYDGSSGWEKKGDQVRLLEAGELNNIREEAENAIEGPLLDYGARGSKAETLGKVDLNGKPAYKLKITTGLGTSITQFLDATTYLEIHEEIERSVNGSGMTIVEDVGDYRDVDGVKFAHRFVSGTRENPSASTLQIEKMQLNLRVEPSEFNKPAK